MARLKYCRIVLGSPFYWNLKYLRDINHGESDFRTLQTCFINPSVSINVDNIGNGENLLVYTRQIEELSTSLRAVLTNFGWSCWPDWLIERPNLLQKILQVIHRHRRGFIVSDPSIMNTTLLYKFFAFDFCEMQIFYLPENI